MKKAVPEFEDRDCKPADLPLRDLDRARAIAGGDAALADGMFKDMLRDLPTQLEKILRLHAEKDWEALKESVHYLRGSVLYCAVPALEHSLLILKAAAASGQPDDIERHLQALESEVERLLASKHRNHG